jgi:hypothetical protein
MRLILVLLAGLLLLSTLAAAQVPADDEVPRRVVLVDGTVIIGVIEDETADPLVIRTPAGVEQRVARALVREITRADVLRLDPNRSRLMFSPTARTMQRGSGRFTAYQIFFPSIAYGITDHLDASFSLSLLPGSSTQIVSGNVKARVISQGLLDGAVGGSVTVPVGAEGGEVVVGTVYGLITYGSERQSATVGAYGAFGGTTTEGLDLEFADGVAFLLGLESQLSNEIKLISENYLLLGEGESGGLLSGGIRFFGERLAADFGLILPVGFGRIEGLPVFPWLGFAYNFGR